MFNIVYEIKYRELMADMVLKPTALLAYLEDIATRNADMLDFGYNSISANNYGWFLLKYAIEFFDYPQNLSAIKVATESRGANKLFAYRDFYMYDLNDKLIGKAASTWALIDLSNKSMVNPLITFDGKIQQFEKKDTDLAYDKIPAISEVFVEKTFDVRNDDIDVNSHVNNTVYLLWALETLPLEFLNNKKLKKLDINYKKELTYGNSAISRVQVLNDNITIHEVKNKVTGEDLCIFKAVWK